LPTDEARNGLDRLKAPTWLPTTVLIVVTALAVLVLAATLVVVAYKTRMPHRHATDKTTNDRFAGDAVPAQVEIKTIVARPRDGDRKSVAASRRSPAIY